VSRQRAGPAGPRRDVPLTLLVAAAERAEARSLRALAARVAARLGHAVEAAPAGPAGAALVGALQQQVDRGTVRLVMLPVAAGQADGLARAVDELVATLVARWPGLCVHRGAPPAPEDVARILGDRAREATGALSEHRAAASESVVVLARPSGGSPAANAELARLARLVYEAHRFAEVGYAFLDLSPPTIAESIARWARLGARRVVVVPCVLFAGRARRGLVAETHRAAAAAGVRVAVARSLSPHPALVGALVRRHVQALSDGPRDGAGPLETVPYVRPELLLGLRHAHAHADGTLAELEARIAALLPPRYRDPGVPVNAAPMGTAPLQYDADGAVAWERVWQGFCELALAGGPPHRGTLLEAPTREQALAEPVRQGAVLHELERGIRAITGLEVVRDGPPGWIGVVCRSEPMAIWLLRAIVVENVMARREGTILYLPAGPRFELGREIKNVVTAVAKCHHYWTEHAAAQNGPPE
jgi:sirohydrochlorin cobaltochelatase